MAAMLFMAAIPASNAYAQSAIEIMPPSVNIGVTQNVVNSPVFLSATITNMNDFTQPFVAVFEVRDAGGSTVFVKLEAGSLLPSAQQAPRTFWIPEVAGEYVARAFVISSISEPEVLSPTASTSFAVVKSMQPEPEAAFLLKEAPSSSLIYQLKQHALEQINKDREQFGLEPVQLSRNIAAQKHADDMLATKVLSHWTTDGEKPYMAYSKYGGLGMVVQNVAMSGSLEYYRDCTSGDRLCDLLDPFEQIDLHQYGMVYADDVCCGNMHRDNILDPFHTEVSIGIAYDAYTFVMVQNFENNYIKLDQSPAKRANYVELVGDIPRGKIHAINVHYDEKPSAAVYEQNKGSTSYELGELVATVEPPGTNSTSAIVADYWNLYSQSIEIGFSLNSVNERRGAYTIVMLFEDDDGNIFPAMSYSLL